LEREWACCCSAATVRFLNRRQLHRSERQGVCGYRPCHVFGKTCFSKAATVTRIRATGGLRISPLPRFRESVFLKSCNSHKDPSNRGFADIAPATFSEKTCFSKAATVTRIRATGGFLSVAPARVLSFLAPPLRCLGGFSPFLLLGLLLGLASLLSCSYSSLARFYVLSWHPSLSCPPVLRPLLGFSSSAWLPRRLALSSPLWVFGCPGGAPPCGNPRRSLAEAIRHQGRVQVLQPGHHGGSCAE